MFHVPTIDISPFVEGGSAARGDAARREFDTACREVGFIQVVGHGVPDAVIAGLESAMDDFFVGLDADAKLAYRTPPGVNRGYAPPKSEATSLSLGIAPANMMNDFFEAFNVGLTCDDYPGADLSADQYQDNLWPDIPAFRERVTSYLGHARRVAQTLTTIAIEALGQPGRTLESEFAQATGTLRLNNYALAEGMRVTLDGELRGMGEHTDFGVITVLWADRVPGLQVLGTDGRWHDVQPAEGALLVNLGDVMTRWTNEHWMSTLHRVKPPVTGGTIQRRRSAAYFHGSNWNTLIQPLAALLAPGEQPLYAPVTATEHIRAKLAGTRAGVLNPNAGREGARAAGALS
ncbi:MAG: 2-oxoglutarate and iron-dependent oxygenase domain-containing protein [Microbacterium sp.]|uniref:isopenicillin N synthase family dioxygenase n=1 Tax=Microbacterium sp. TaxID=51671 RepID=UPI0039E5BAB6